jgi:hypothetical protein
MSEDLLKYRFLNRFLPEPKKKRLLVLTGARQTGKTTLAKLRYPELSYINLDAPEDREKLRNLPASSWSQTIGNAIIDEAQKEPVVFEKVKYAYDQGGISFSLLLGSSQILLLKKIRESLAGRVALYELWPLLMSEVAQDDDSSLKTLPLVDRLFSEEKIDTIFKGIPSLLLGESDSRLHNAEDYLLHWGGMPALLTLSEEERWKWLKDYEYTYLERDLSDLARLDDLQPFRKFQKLSALRSGKLLNYSEIARDAAVSVDTARRYLEYLRLSYQVILLQPYGKNLTSTVIKTPKLYWLDIGLLRQLSGMRGQYSGEIYETMVVTELYKWMNTAQNNGEMFFYRTRSGLELDTILQTDHGIIGVEIKSRKKIVSSDIRAMREVASAAGEWRGGLVIYQGDEVVKLSEPSIWAVPSRRLFT